MENFSATDASETSSASVSVSSSSTSQSDRGDETFHQPSSLGGLLDIAPLIGHRRLDSSCMYVQEEVHRADDLRKNIILNPALPQQINCPSDGERLKRPHPGVEKSIKATNTFLEMRSHLNMEEEGNTNVAGMGGIVEAKDYERYLIANSASPNAIRESLLFCLKNDDVNLADTLLRDVGIEYLLRHCYLTAMPDIDDASLYDTDDDHSLMSDHRVQEANIYWLACFYGSAQVLDMLCQCTLAYFLENDANYVGIVFNDSIAIEHTDTRRNEIVMDNAMTRAKSMLTDLLEKPVTLSHNTPLYTASERNNGDVISVLLKHYADPNTPNRRGNTPALIASTLNNVQALQGLEKSNLVDWGKENKKGMVPVMAASQCGNLEALQILNRCVGMMTNSSVNFTVVDPDGFGCAALAARFKQVDVIRYFSKIHDPKIANGININQTNPDSETALHAAVRYQYSDIVHTLLETTPCHCDATMKNSDDMTALHLAVRGNYPNVVREFVNCLSLETLALLDTIDKSGSTPLYHAARMGFLDVVKILAPVSDLGIMGRVLHSRVVRNQPALAAAAIAGNVDVMTLLLHCGADVNQTDDQGHTAVSLASKYGKLESVKTLVTNGADLQIRSNKGSKTPLQKARRYKRQEVAEYLEKNGGR
mmetsp:Transcript_17544/g.20927  ORF Transcript_17544/g.20927 Transcript_17544/m.20927 type:complete len:650 (-) Transcript_17544:150-2099(-)